MVPIKLTLPPGTVRKFGLPGGKVYEFEGGKPTLVPSVVATACMSKRENGQKIFERADDHDFDADIERALGVQVEWAGWPSTLP